MFSTAKDHYFLHTLPLSNSPCDEGEKAWGLLQKNSGEKRKTSDVFFNSSDVFMRGSASSGEASY